jgi:hypothetical protein
VSHDSFGGGHRLSCVGVTATYAYDEQPHTGHPLLPGASPYNIRAALLPEDRDRFDAEYRDALTEARESLDLAELFKMLEQWRRVALLQSDPADFRRVVRRAAELLTGEAVPDDEPLAVTRTKAGM